MVSPLVQDANGLGGAKPPALHAETRAMRVALWQGPSTMGDDALADSTLQQALLAAGAAGAAVLVAPEVYLPGYNQNDIPARAISRAQAQSRLAGYCRNAHCGLVVGYGERAGDTLYNAAIALDAQGEPVAHYRKVQLYGARESALYAPGDAYATFDLHGVKAALLICYDIEFAPHVAALAAMGVTLILVPTANMQPFTHVAAHTVPAMAANYGLSIVYANYCGVEGDLAYVGSSLITGPHGEVLAQAGQSPALLITDLPDVDQTRVSTQFRDLRKV